MRNKLHSSSVSLTKSLSVFPNAGVSVHKLVYLSGAEQSNLALRYILDP